MFGQLKKLDDERKQLLIEKLQSGAISKAGEDELICNYLILGMRLVRKIGYQYQIKDRSDLEGVMALAIVTGIQRYKQKNTEENYLTKYLIKTIILKLKTHIKTFSAAHKSERTIRYKLQKGINNKNLTIKELETLEPERAQILKKLTPMLQFKHLENARTLSIIELRQTVQNAIYESLQIGSRMRILEDIPKTLSDDCTDDIYAGYIPFSREEVRADLLEALKMTAQTPMEQAILDLRSQGYTYAEVGEKVGYSFVAIGEKVRAMETRFEEIWK